MIPVKYSERLPYKHFLTLGGRTLLEIAIEKAERFGKTTVYSRIDLPVSYEKDRGRSIIDLMNMVSSKVSGSFLMMGPDMPFIMESDISRLIELSDGEPIIAVHEDGQYEPMFAIYRHGMTFERSLHETFRREKIRVADTSEFSSNAFININTPEDYIRALEIFRSH